MTVTDRPWLGWQRLVIPFLKTRRDASAGQAIATWWVTAVNPTAGTISLVNPAGGEIRTYNVSTAEGRAQLPRVKPGDSVTAINSSVAVIAITPK